MITSFYIFKTWRFGMRGNKYIGWTMVFAFMYFYNLFVAEFIQNMFIDSYYVNVIRHICITHYLIEQIRRSRRLFY